MSQATPSGEITQYPLLPLRDVVVFPHMVIPLFVGRPKSIKAMETAMEAGKSILLVAQRSAAKDDPGPEDMYAIGCVSNAPLAGPGNRGPGGAWRRWLPCPDWS